MNLSGKCNGWKILEPELESGVDNWLETGYPGTLSSAGYIFSGKADEIYVYSIESGGLNLVGADSVPEMAPLPTGEKRSLIYHLHPLIGRRAKWYTLCAFDSDTRQIFCSSSIQIKRSRVVESKGCVLIVQETEEDFFIIDSCSNEFLKKLAPSAPVISIIPVLDGESFVCSTASSVELLHAGSNDQRVLYEVSSGGRLGVLAEVDGDIYLGRSDQDVIIVEKIEIDSGRRNLCYQYLIKDLYSQEELEEIRSDDAEGIDSLYSNVSSINSSGNYLFITVGGSGTNYLPEISRARLIVQEKDSAGAFHLYDLSGYDGIRNACFISPDTYVVLCGSSTLLLASVSELFNSSSGAGLSELS